MRQAAPGRPVRHRGKAVRGSNSCRSGACRGYGHRHDIGDAEIVDEPCDGLDALVDVADDPRLRHGFTALAEALATFGEETVVERHPVALGLPDGGPISFAVVRHEDAADDADAVVRGPATRGLQPVDPGIERACLQALWQEVRVVFGRPFGARFDIAAIHSGGPPSCT